MKQIKKLGLGVFLSLGISLGVFGLTDSVSIDTVDNYNGWGWEVLVVRNDYITLGIVPVIGGRVLQYDLGVDTFMIINESMKGDLFNPDNTLYGPWSSWGYGGYKTWPAPQSEWNWPPPPFMDWGAYEYETLHASKDSVKVWLKGQTEEYQSPGLRFDRYITAYRNSTRVKVETVLFNDNTAQESWSIWDVTQTIVRHNNDNDYENISGYIPIAGSDDIWDNGGGPLCEEVLPGIYRVRYNSREGKMFAMSSEGWTCWVDERDGQCYAKLFDLVEGASYPDDGANVEYYTSGNNRYMEMEVLGPIEPIGPNGDSIIFVEDWYAASAAGPMYTASHAGTVITPLSFSRLDKTLRGEFGIFNEGELHVSYLNSGESEISSDSLMPVTPSGMAVLEQVIVIPENTRFIELKAYDVYSGYIASLGKIEVSGDDSFTAYKAGSEVTIDGEGNEDFWVGADWYPLDFVWLPYNDIVSLDDFNGRFKLSWTDENLLLLVEITDDVLYDGHAAPLQNYWDDDCVEVFLDEDHSGGNHLNSFNAFAYHVGLSYDVVDNSTTGAALFNDHIEVVRTQEVNTYTWELAIKVYDDTYIYGGSNDPVVLSDGKEMGFSLAYCDNDGSPSRENFIGSKYLPEAQSNDSYINASLFGTLTLVDTIATVISPEILNDEQEGRMEIYPNPANDALFVSFYDDAVRNFSYRISNLTGQVMQSGEIVLQQQSGVIPINSLPSGIYLINFISGDLNISKQILKR